MDEHEQRLKKLEEESAAVLAVAKKKDVREHDVLAEIALLGDQAAAYQYAISLSPVAFPALTDEQIAQVENDSDEAKP